MRAGAGAVVCVLAAGLASVLPAVLLRGQQEGQPVVQHLDGAGLFRERGCSFCHGADLSGTEKGPSLQGVGRRLKKEAIARQIREGGGTMPAFAEVLADEEIARLVAFLAQQKKAPPRHRPPA